MADFDLDNTSISVRSFLDALALPKSATRPYRDWLGQALGSHTQQFTLRTMLDLLCREHFGAGSYEIGLLINAAHSEVHMSGKVKEAREAVPADMPQRKRWEAREKARRQQEAEAERDRRKQQAEWDAEEAAELAAMEAEAAARREAERLAVEEAAREAEKTLAVLSPEQRAAITHLIQEARA